MRTISVMQGRLTNKGGFYPQNFPWDNWEQEFYTAQKIGLHGIEWMFNTENFTQNPLWTSAGRETIRKLVKSTGVRVESVCMNYFMQNSITDHKCEEHIEIFSELLSCSRELNIRKMVLPLFEASRIIDGEQLINNLTKVLKKTLSDGILIALETDASAEKQREVCEKIGDKRVGLCYDLGNACGNGCHIEEELCALKDYLLEIHVKDKKTGGNSVMLGEGDVDYPRYLNLLRKLEYREPLVMESYFGENAIEDTYKNYSYLRGLLDE